MVTENSLYTFPYLADGEYEIGVRAIDNVGNENTTSVNVTIDTKAPSLEINRSIDGEVVEPGDITVEWSGYDSVTGISHFEIRLNNDSWYDVGDLTEYTFDDLDEGEYNVTVRAVDEAGNTAVKNVEFKVEEETLLGTIGDLVMGNLWLFIAPLIAMLFLVLLLADRKARKSRYGEASSRRDIAECGNCGASIPGYLSYCPKCGAEFSDGVICKNCGMRVYGDPKECPECGTDFYLEGEESDFE